MEAAKDVCVPADGKILCDFPNAQITIITSEPVSAWKVVHTSADGQCSTDVVGVHLALYLGEITEVGLCPQCDAWITRG